MKLKFTTFVAVILLSLGWRIISMSQSQADTNLPRRIDSYGAIACDDAMSRLDFFAIQLQNESHSQGYIVVYPEKNGLPGKYLSYMNFAKEYLEATRGITPSRLTTFSGGLRDNLTTELWIAPANAPPSVTAVTIEPESSPVARKFDEGFADYSTYRGKRYLWTYDLCGLGAIYLKAYAEHLRSGPDAKGYIIIYTERGKRARARTVARLFRDELVKGHKIAADRVVTVYGGRREMPEAELWIVPKGAAVPKPSPKL
jgi:hypothetical protein